MMRYPTIVSLAAVTLLAGCASTSSSDTADGLRERQAAYCTETSPATRAVALAVIRAQVPDYPVSGLCTDADQALADELARQLADLPPGATIDLEQAVEDQRRFEEMRDADSDTPAAQN